MKSKVKSPRGKIRELQAIIKFKQDQLEQTNRLKSILNRELEEERRKAKEKDEQIKSWRTQGELMHAMVQLLSATMLVLRSKVVELEGRPRWYVRIWKALIRWLKKPAPRPMIEIKVNKDAIVDPEKFSRELVRELNKQGTGAKNISIEFEHGGKIKEGEMVRSQTAEADIYSTWKKIPDTLKSGKEG